MKIIKIYAPGTIVGKKRIKMHNKWVKDMKKFIKDEFGLPTNPINTCFRIIIRATHGSRYPRENGDMASSVHAMLAYAGIIKEESFKTTGRTEQTSRYEKDVSSFEVEIWADDKNVFNSLVNWKEFNVTGENNVTPDKRGSGFIVKEMKERKRKEIRGI